MAHGGSGVGRCVDSGADARVWFVEGALPGEVVEAELLRESKRHITGRLLRVQEASPSRVAEPCPLANECGGCNWQHLRVSDQARYKREIVTSQLRRLDLEVGQAVPSPKALGYRRRARLHYVRSEGGLQLGFRRARSRDVIDVPSCPVLSSALDGALRRVRELGELLPAEGEVLGLTDGTRVVLGLPGVKPSEPLRVAVEALLDDVLIGVTLRGGRKRMDVGRTRLSIDSDENGQGIEIGPMAFAQAQSDQNAALVEHVAKSAKSAMTGSKRGPGRILELYAGAGNFTRRLARLGGKVVTVDSDREAVAALEAWARRGDRPVDARRGAVERVLSKLVEAKRSFDLTVLDPPRAGLPKGAVDDLATVTRGGIIYVSCDPATLARDLKDLEAAGFECRDLRVFDMMPMTSDVECVATLVRAKRGRPAP
jgi:23S rRNA (uracil1939-C5)-methyltransferase